MKPVFVLGLLTSFFTSACKTTGSPDSFTYTAVHGGGSPYEDGFKIVAKTPPKGQTWDGKNGWPYAYVSPTGEVYTAAGASAEAFATLKKDFGLDRRQLPTGEMVFVWPSDYEPIHDLHHAHLRLAELMRE